ncbi:DUF6920 family protein [Hyalangium gracile]|uniref:DUF6920 family protein n=1 Tax=Hyalangium gracile TaxID=394092 RepID=UPI001CCA50C8|nr:DUF6544 family protein [Hyalangium gracile]
MTKDSAFDELWNDPIAPGAPFDPKDVAGLPSSARRYLEHAIAPGTPLASAVRLRMTGTIKLKDQWHPFAADQVIRWNRGFVWRAKVKMNGLPVTGSDRWIDGEGAMRWKLLGLVPIVTASGPDISRSAADRVQIESLWLPSVLVAPSVSWTEHDATHVGLNVSLRDRHAHCEYSLDEQGRLRTVSMLRWGDPQGQGFGSLPFGGVAEEERTFGGFTIPSKLRIGWYFGTERFEPEGEFFRCTVEEAVYR